MHTLVAKYCHNFSLNIDLFGILVPFVCYVMVIIGYMTSLSTYRHGNKQNCCTHILLLQTSVQVTLERR